MFRESTSTHPLSKKYLLILLSHGRYSGKILRQALYLSSGDLVETAKIFLALVALDLAFTIAN